MPSSDPAKMLVALIRPTVREFVTHATSRHPGHSHSYTNPARGSGRASHAPRRQPAKIASGMSAETT